MIPSSLRSRIPVVVWLATLLLAYGCSDGRPLAPDTNAGGAAGAPPLLVSLEFELEGSAADQQTLEVVPEQDIELTVVASPPDIYRVRFSILEYTNDSPVDASLDRTDAVTDDDGRATVRLVAPSKPSSFELRAAIGNVAYASLDVRVEEKSYGELEVTPDYDGRRPIDEYFTVAYPSQECNNVVKPTSLSDATCDENDESRPCALGPPGAVLRIQKIWAGVPYAVALGSGLHVWGCAQVNGILANDLSFVTVSVSNRRMTLDEEPMNTVFGINETAEPWVEHLNSAIDASMTAFTEGAENDVALILARMADRVEGDTSPTVRAGFEQRWVDNDWERLALESFISQDGVLLRSRLRNWMVTGAGLLQSDDALIGRIDPIGPQEFEFSITEVVGVDAEHAGFETTSETTTWTDEGDDQLVLGTELVWAPSRLVTALGEAAALQEFDDQTSLEGALSRVVDCSLFAQILIDSNEIGIYPRCDLACGAELCRSALDSLAQRAREAQLEPQRLAVSAAGPAIVDELARPASFDGAWLGRFPGTETVIVSGPIAGLPTGPAD